MIRFFHTSDWHLGRFLHGKSLLEDQSFALDRLLELIDKQKPHALLIAGDVFDRALPPEAAVKLFDSFLSRTVLERGLPVFLIPGNHDSAERLGFASQILRERGLTIFARPEEALTPMTIEGDNGAKALIYGIPFVEPVLIGQMLGQPEVRTPDDAVRAVNKRILNHLSTSALDLPAILLCHAFVIGGEGSESERDIFVGGSSYVDVSAFEGFAYTALGHLHKPQRAGSDRVRYSGSLLPYSKSEIGHNKAVVEILMQPKGDFKTVEHTLEQKRALRYVEGTIDELLKTEETELQRDDYIIAGYTDSGPVLDALSRLRSLYPNLLHITRTGGFQPSQLPAVSRAKERERLSELDLYAEFFQETTGIELSGEERAKVTSVIEALDRGENLS